MTKLSALKSIDPQHPAVEPPRHFSFFGREMTPAANLALWRQAVETLFEVTPLDDIDKDEFTADFESVTLGQILIGRTLFSPQKFSRSKEFIARSNVHHIVIQLYTQGGFHGSADSVPIKVSAGAICVFDLALPFETRAERSDSITLVIPRSIFEVRFPEQGMLHGLVLSSGKPLTDLLGQQIKALWQYAEILSENEGLLAAEGIIALSLACLKPSLSDRAALHPKTQLPAIVRIRQHINQQLTNADLSVDTIAASLGLSRSVLYRLFAPLGGVANYIRNRRLDQAFYDLAQSKAKISEVARLWHFGSSSSFTRAFKAFYGINPSDVISGVVKQKGDLDRSNSSDDLLITRWMRELDQEQVT